MTSINKQLFDALEGLAGISYRLDGCPEPNCRVCQDNKAKLDAANAALSAARAQMAQEGAASDAPA